MGTEDIQHANELLASGTPMTDDLIVTSMSSSFSVGSSAAMT